MIYDLGADLYLLDGQSATNATYLLTMRVISFDWTELTGLTQHVIMSCTCSASAYMQKNHCTTLHCSAQ